MSPGRLSELFPLPFVAVVVLLVVLIFLTPNLLFSGNPPAGSLVTEAQLTIDAPPGSSMLHFYVQGLSSVRYSVLSATLVGNVSWPPPSNLSGLHWKNVSYGTEVLSAAFLADGNPVALNVSATYVDSAGVAVTYWGLYALNVSGSTLYTTSLDPSLPSVPPTPVASLPLTILLETATPGSPR